MAHSIDLYLVPRLGSGKRLQAVEIRLPSVPYLWGRPIAHVNVMATPHGVQLCAYTDDYKYDGHQAVRLLAPYMDLLWPHILRHYGLDAPLPPKGPTS